MRTFRNALALAATLAVILAPLPASAGGRFYVVHVPHGAGAKGATRPTTAVVYLHSFGHDHREGAALGWSRLADAKGFLAVYPDGDGSWNAGLCCGAAARAGRDDSAWLASVIYAVRLRYRVSRVYVAGYSNGGMMAERLVAERPWLTTRIAVTGSAPEMPKAGAWTGRAFIWHGALDTIVPWHGGIVLLGGQLVTIRPAQYTRLYLLGATLSATVIANLGHEVPANWPALAWGRLSA